MMADNYIFSYNQLKALLAGYGYDCISGLALGNSVLDYQALTEALNKLLRDGMISSDGESFIGSDAAKRISERIGNALSYTLIHTKRNFLPDLCCYCGEDLLICSDSLCSVDCVSVRFSDFNDFYDSLRDEGYLPMNSEGIVPDEEDLNSFEEEVFKSYCPNQPINPDSAILFAAEKIDCDGNILECVRVLEYYFCDYIRYLKGNQAERVLYDSNNVRLFLKRLMN